MESEKIEEMHQEKIEKALLVCLFDGKTYELNSNASFIIGRGSSEADNAILIDEKIVSRKHAQILFDGGFALIDLKSKNGTYLNSSRISAGEKYYLKEGDIIEFSKMKYRFENLPQSIKFILHDYLCQFVEIEGDIKLSVDINDKDIISYQEKILDLNECKGLLKMAVLKTNNRIKLFYDTEGLETLDNVLKKREITRSEMVFVLKSITKVMKNARKYLLNESNFSLLPESIFLNSETLEVKLIYIPVEIKDFSNYTYFKKLIYFFSEAKNDEIIQFIKEVSSAIQNEKRYLDDFQIFLSKENELFYIKKTEIESDETDLAIEKKAKKDRRMSLKDKNTQLVLIQCGVLIVLGTILFSGILKTVDFIGFSIILLATDIWFLRIIKLV